MQLWPRRLPTKCYASYCHSFGNISHERENIDILLEEHWKDL